MLIYALAAILFTPSNPQPAEQANPPQSQRFGAWEVRTRVDAITDEVSIGAYLGTPADNLAIGCAKDAPDSTVVLWRSSTRFRETAYVPRAGEDVRLWGWPAGSTTYRFDQDPPVVAWIMGRQDNSSRFGLTDIQAITRRIGTSRRLVLRDRLYETHTATFDLIPADTVRVLRRLDEVCGTTHSAPPAEPAEVVPENGDANISR